MDEQETVGALKQAKTGLSKALEEGRGVDAQAMLAVVDRLEDRVRNWRNSLAQMNARGSR